MTITQRSPLLFVPRVTLVPVIISDAAEIIVNSTYREVVFNRVTTAASHLDYIITGENLDDVELSHESPADSIDISQFPLVRRVTGINSGVTCRFSNSRGESNSLRLNFSNSGGQTYINNPHALVEGSYAKYCYERVAAIFTGLDSPKLRDSNQNRKNTSRIPHAALTGKICAGGWSFDGGKSFCAITPRVVVGCAHYGYPTGSYHVGDVLTWQTENNVFVTRTVQAVWSGWQIPGPSGSHLIGTDISFYLLDSDLPATIKPFKIIGPWVHNYGEGFTGSNFTRCIQVFGIVLFNNDGHIVPFQHIQGGEELYTGNASTIYEGFTLTFRQTCLYGTGFAGVTFNGNDWNFYNTTSVLYHNVYYGDSGSQILLPVENNEWALAGIISGNLWDETSLNFGISRLYLAAGLSNPQTVVVAANPIP